MIFLYTTSTIFTIENIAVFETSGVRWKACESVGAKKIENVCPSHRCFLQLTAPFIPHIESLNGNFNFLTPNQPQVTFSRLSSYNLPRH